MKVKDTRAQNNRVMFGDLPIGYAYEDSEGFLCIKTYHGSTQDNCLVYSTDREEWEPGVEGTGTLVTPLKTTLLIER